MLSLETPVTDIGPPLPGDLDHDFRTIRRALARGGRPSSLTEEITDQIGDLLSETCEYVVEACESLGIPRRNYYNWMQQGERDALEHLDTPQARFWHTLKTAEAQGLVRIGKLWMSNPRDFAAYATRAERRKPELYAKRSEDGNSPKMVVQIGVPQGDVSVTFASSPSLSPDPHSDLPQLSTAQVEMLGPITSLMVPPEVPADRGHGLTEAPAPRVVVGVDGSAERKAPEKTRRQRWRGAGKKKASVSRG